MFDRIAQLIILGKYNVKFGKVGERVLLGGTKRGSSGFASTGVIVIKKTKLDDWVVKFDVEEAKMEVNDKVVVHEKIAID